MTDHMIETLCDELFREAIESARRHDSPGTHRFLSAALTQRQGQVDEVLRGTEAGTFRRVCSERLRRVARLLAGFEGEVRPQDQHAIDLYVSSAYALVANWVLGGCRAPRESFERHLASLDDRLL